jgi:hypothetical protein
LANLQHVEIGARVLVGARKLGLFVFCSPAGAHAPIAHERVAT